METYYYFRSDMNTYCEGPLHERPEGYIEVPKRPGNTYLFDFNEMQWIQDIELVKQSIRPERNEELIRTDRYMLFDSTLSLEEKNIVAIYRQELRDVPNKEIISDIVMPVCPEIISK